MAKKKTGINWDVLNNLIQEPNESINQVPVKPNNQEIQIIKKINNNPDEIDQLFETVKSSNQQDLLTPQVPPKRTTNLQKPVIPNLEIVTQDNLIPKNNELLQTYFNFGAEYSIILSLSLNNETQSYDRNIGIAALALLNHEGKTSLSDFTTSAVSCVPAPYKSLPELTLKAEYETKNDSLHYAKLNNPIIIFEQDLNDVLNHYSIKHDNFNLSYKYFTACKLNDLIKLLKTSLGGE